MGLFKNLSLRGKLYSGFGFVILLAIFISGIAIYSMIKTSSIEKELRNTIRQDIYQTFDIFSQYTEVHTWLHELQAKPSPALVESGLASTNELLSIANKIPNRILTEQSNTVMTHLEGLCKSILGTRFEELLRAGKYPASQNVFIAEVFPHLIESNTTFNVLLINHIKHLMTLVGELNIGILIYITVGITLFGVVLALLIASSLYIYISSSTRHILKFAKLLENGRFDLNIDESRIHKDEIGDIYHSFIAISLTLNKTLARTIAVSKQLEKQSRELKQASLAINNGASNAEHQSIKVAAAADELVATTTDIANNCHTAQSSSEDTRQETETGMEKVRATVARIKEQALYTKENASKVLRLAEQSQRIGSIVNTIDDIAAQTNLLALNAAIEAARAGEAGRGFAVVADEVRALASRTSDSTKEISAMVGSVKVDSEEATNSMTTSVNQIEEVAESASELETTLHRIVDAVNDVNSQIVQIAHAAEQQTSATSEISSNMQGITEMAQQSVDVSGNAADVATYCDGLIGELLKELEYFTLDESKLDKEHLVLNRVQSRDDLVGQAEHITTQH